MKSMTYDYSVAIPPIATNQIMKKISRLGLIFFGLNFSIQYEIALLGAYWVSGLISIPLGKPYMLGYFFVFARSSFRDSLGALE